MNSVSRPQFLIIEHNLFSMLSTRNIGFSVNSANFLKSNSSGCQGSGFNFLPTSGLDISYFGYIFPSFPTYRISSINNFLSSKIWSKIELQTLASIAAYATWVFFKGLLLQFPLCSYLHIFFPKNLSVMKAKELMTSFGYSFFRSLVKSRKDLILRGFLKVL